MREPQKDGIQWWLARLRSRFTEIAPELLPLLEIYSAEASFGRKYIADDIENLQYGAEILEVGAGSLLLSCQLAREGFKVTALEPIGRGFSHFDRIRQLVFEEARVENCCPEIFALTAELLAETSRFDYAFSINVMEHVENVAVVLRNVGKSLRVGATYRFTCPNYSFPYEPHFNIPTLLSKRLTEIVFGKMLVNSKRVTDPKGIWQSLNWISVIRVGRCVRRFHWLQIQFNRSIMVTTLERIVSDQDFAARRSPRMRRFLAGLVHFRLHRPLGLVPAIFLPVIDCRIRKIADAKRY